MRVLCFLRPNEWIPFDENFYRRSHTHECHCAMCMKNSGRKNSAQFGIEWNVYGWKFVRHASRNPELEIHALIECMPRQTAQCTFAIHFCRSAPISLSLSLSHLSVTARIQSHDGLNTHHHQQQLQQPRNKNPSKTVNQNKNVDQCDLSKCKCHNETNNKKKKLNLLFSRF